MQCRFAKPWWSEAKAFRLEQILKTLSGRWCIALNMHPVCRTGRKKAPAKREKCCQFIQPSENHAIVPSGRWKLSIKSRSSRLRNAFTCRPSGSWINRNLSTCSRDCWACCDFFKSTVTTSPPRRTESLFSYTPLLLCAAALFVCLFCGGPFRCSQLLYLFSFVLHSCSHTVTVSTIQSTYTLVV